MINELLEKFEDLFQPASDEEMRNRIEKMDGGEIRDEIDDTIGGWGIKDLAYIYDEIGDIETAEQLISRHIDNHVEMLIENGEPEELTNFFLKILKRENLSNS